MARNKIAGSTRGTSATARYYQNNPKARAKKKRYDTKNLKKYQSNREDTNKKARRDGTYGKRYAKGVDIHHGKGGKMSYKSRKWNRGEANKRKKKNKMRTFLKKKRKY